MKTTDLLIQDVDLSIDPDLEDRHFGWVDIEFRVIGDPEYLDDIGALAAEFGLDVDLNLLPNPLVNEVEEQEKVGEIEIEVISIIEGDEDEFEEYISQWKEENYRSLPFMFRYHIESAFMSDVMSTLANLLNNVYRGVLPQVTFTESPPDIEEEQYEVEIGGFDIDEEDHEELQEKIEQFLDDIEPEREEFVKDMEDIVGESLSLDVSTELTIEEEEEERESS